ncbi:MAG: hypothetical protein CMD22_03005 [Flavobacteriales bacterium]|nr:hypothetical protein [Flavobacteriales bacterium]|tara:strand:- start:873 stop:1388 length:516 start_codon:yes stop_codon:yes gene_type:complete
MLSREYAREKYADVMGLDLDHNIVKNLEIHTFNWAYRRSKELGDIPAENNRNHVQRYKHKFLSIMYNLKNSSNLKDRILGGELKTGAVINLSPQGLWPDGPCAKMSEQIADIEMKKLHAANYMHDKDYKGLFRCAKCRGYKTTFYQMQTRSADEPMTVFITCHTCNRRWKS